MKEKFSEPIIELSSIASGLFHIFVTLILAWEHDGTKGVVLFFSILFMAPAVISITRFPVWANFSQDNGRLDERILALISIFAEIFHVYTTWIAAWHHNGSWDPILFVNIIFMGFAALMVYRALKTRMLANN